MDQTRTFTARPSKRAPGDLRPVSLERGVAKELARILLPQNVYTQAYWTVSLQGVIHFLSQRLQPDAQYEIRRYAEGVYQLVASELARVGITRELLLAGE